MYEDNKHSSGENKVRAARQISFVKPISIGFCKESLLYCYFWSCMFSFDLGHAVGSTWIGHGRLTEISFDHTPQKDWTETSYGDDGG